MPFPTDIPQAMESILPSHWILFTINEGILMSSLIQSKMACIPARDCTGNNASPNLN